MIGSVDEKRGKSSSVTLEEVAMGEDVVDRHLVVVPIGD